MTTSIAQQDIDALGGPGSILTRQRHEHQQLDHLLARLDRSGGREQDAVLQDVARLVFPHAFAEEAVIWPLARRQLPDGEELTLRVEREHQQINELWTRLEQTPHDDPARGELLAQITTLLRQDVRDEEDELLPRLQEQLMPAQLRRAGLAWAAVRRIAPTRPHPVVARRPPGNVVAAVPLSLLDRGRDRLDRLARRGSGHPSAAASRLSNRIASVAGRLERVPPLPDGDDSSTHRSPRGSA